MTVSGNWQLIGNGNLTVKDGLTLSGTLSLGNTTSVGYLNFSNTETLGGTGTVVFGSTYSGQSYDGLYGSTAGTTLTIGANVTVRGKLGIIGSYYPYLGATNVNVVNQGIIQSDVSGGTIYFYVNGTASQNAGTMNVLNGANLSLQGTLANAATLYVDATSSLSLSGTLMGGTITTQTGARFMAAR